LLLYSQEINLFGILIYQYRKHLSIEHIHIKQKKKGL
jgi:hypothetical protein